MIIRKKPEYCEKICKQHGYRIPYCIYCTVTGKSIFEKVKQEGGSEYGKICETEDKDI